MTDAQAFALRTAAVEILGADVIFVVLTLGKNEDLGIITNARRVQHVPELLETAAELAASEPRVVKLS